MFSFEIQLHFYYCKRDERKDVHPSICSFICLLAEYHELKHHVLLLNSPPQATFL